MYFLLFPYHKKFSQFFPHTRKNRNRQICYHNISNQLWKKLFQCKENKISKTLQILGLTASNLQTFFSIFFLTLEQFFLTLRQNNYGNKIPFLYKLFLKRQTFLHKFFLNCLKLLCSHERQYILGFIADKFASHCIDNVYLSKTVWKV